MKLVALKAQGKTTIIISWSFQTGKTIKKVTTEFLHGFQ